jgi:hypothetical protein
VKMLQWKGEENREVGLYRPCSCGCGDRDPETRDAVGYISGSDEKGHGFTIFLFKDADFKTLARVFPVLGGTA